MRRFMPALLVCVGLTALTLLFFGDVLFRDRQLAYRDAAHYYYPLYQRVQAEWDAGRWPLWEPEENSGMPLIGNPTAAVLYPGKILYAGVPYALGAKLYIIAHVILAFVAMIILMRHWRISWTGSALGGLGYAFGMPVLFQYCNVIYLVGAAWAPLGFHAADRWLRQGRRWGLIELAIVIAMQVLGGEPQSAYVIGICSAGYALALGWEAKRSKQPSLAFSSMKRAVLLGGSLILWTVLVLVAAYMLPRFRKPGLPKNLLPWVFIVPYLVFSCWSLLILRCIYLWRSRRRSLRLPTMLVGLMLAGGLGGAMTSAQLLPVLEYTSRTARAVEEGPHDVYPFSLEPIRVVETIWPRVFGSNYGESTHWFYALPPLNGHAKEWIPSLYIGGITLLLGLASFGHGEARVWQKWLWIVAIITFFAALGEYAGPLWWARCLNPVTRILGKHDTIESGVIRFDDQLRDGDGSFYWFLATALPGFGQFRYPAKMLTFTSLALAALSGVGWDHLVAGRTRSMKLIAKSLLILSALTIVIVVLYQSRIVNEFMHYNQKGARGAFGPLDPLGAWWAIVISLIHGIFWMLAILMVAHVTPRRQRLGCTLILIASCVDLWVANKRCLVTVAQSTLDAKPKAVQIIEDAERADPDVMPFRVHRMPSWEPMIWSKVSSPDRLGDLVRWEHATIQPKYGLLFGINYTFTLGVAELFDYDMFLAAFMRKVDDSTARALGIQEGDKVVYHARRGYDLWNSRYFIVPVYPAGWNTELRGYASFMTNVEKIYPPRDAFKGPDGEALQRKWIEEEDMQIFRNKQVMPRSWIVHQAKFLAPIKEMGRALRTDLMESMIYQDDALWHDSARVVHDLRRICWIEADRPEREELGPFLSGGPSDANESVSFLKYEPQRVEIRATLKRPGIVILADINFPGWTLSIDDKPAPIRVVNRIMRGAAVPSGEHTLVYTYEPRSFRNGGYISLGSIGILGLLTLLAWRRPQSVLLAEPV